MKTIDEDHRRKLLLNFVTTFHELAELDTRRKIIEPFNKLVDYYDDVFDSQETARLYLLLYFQQMQVERLTHTSKYYLDVKRLAPLVKKRLDVLQKRRDENVEFTDAIQAELLR